MASPCFSSSATLVESSSVTDLFMHEDHADSKLRQVLERELAIMMDTANVHQNSGEVVALRGLDGGA